MRACRLTRTSGSCPRLLSRTSTSARDRAAQNRVEGAGQRSERGLRRRDDVARPGPRDRAAYVEERVADEQTDEPDDHHDGDHDEHNPQDPAPRHLHTAVLVVVDLGRRHRDSMQPRIWSGQGWAGRRSNAKRFLQPGPTRTYGVSAGGPSG